jgi:hypothetical protein
MPSSAAYLAARERTPFGGSEMRLRAQLAIAAVLAALAPGACVFVLDFDELQARDGANDGGGEAGCNCASDDPCRPQVCEAGKCVEQVFVGLADDGYHGRFQGEKMHRITLTNVGSAFYGSVFYDDGQPRLGFFRVPIHEKADGVRPQTRLSTELSAEGVLPALIDAVPASAAGLLSPDSLILATFGTTTGGVFVLYVGSDLRITNASLQLAAADYSGTDPRRHPQAWIASKQAYIGWITNAGKVRVPGTPMVEFGDGAVTSFGPLITAGGAAVAWLEGSVFARHQNQAVAELLADCPSIKAWTPVALSTFGVQGSPAPNFAAWTKTSGGESAVQTRTIGCSNELCAPVTTDPSCGQPQATDDVNPGLRHFEYLASRIPEQDANKYYEVFASSLESTGVRQVFLQAREYDTNTDLAEALGEAVMLTPIEPVSEAGDHPVLAFSGIDKILVAWVHPGEAHVRRFRICPRPKADDAGL